jgi:hypothetical protein
LNSIFCILIPKKIIKELLLAQSSNLFSYNFQEFYKFIQILITKM